jgi:hypothetical protein
VLLKFVFLIHRRKIGYLFLPEDAASEALLARSPFGNYHNLI